MDELKKVLRENLIDNDEVTKAIDELVEEECQQTKQCANKGRTAAGILFATSWGFLLQGEFEHNGWLAIVILLSTLYFALDMLRHLWYSYLARKLYWKSVEIRNRIKDMKMDGMDVCLPVNDSETDIPERDMTSKEIRTKLSTLSDKTFNVLKLQMLLLIIMVITLGVFVCIKYNIL